MIWNPLSILATLFPAAAKKEAAAAARRWRRAAERDPDLRADLIRFGAVLAHQPVRLMDGFPEVEPIEPTRLAYEAGRRDLALQLLALTGLTPADMNILMEDNNA